MTPYLVPGVVHAVAGGGTGNHVREAVIQLCDGEGAADDAAQCQGQGGDAGVDATLAQLDGLAAGLGRCRGGRGRGGGLGGSNLALQSEEERVAG